MFTTEDSIYELLNITAVSVSEINPTILCDNDLNIMTKQNKAQLHVKVPKK